MRGVVFLLLTVLTLFACQSEYEKMVKEGLAQAVRQDSIFLGMTFGMTADSFYQHCWNMNRMGLFINGPKNRSVQYDISEELDHPGKIFFYPTFYEDRIYEMPVTFAYDAFAWGEDYGADSLLVDVLDMMETWYGEFKEFNHPDKGVVYVNINANRQIRLFKNERDNSVNAVFTDLSVDKKEAEKAAPEKTKEPAGVES